MTSAYDGFLARLKNVTPLGNGRYKACCPAHPDKTPSLSIAIKSDCVLFHCHAGCDPHDVVSAVGLSFADLYPTKAHYIKPYPEKEMLILKLAKASLDAGVELDEHDKARVELALKRLGE